MPYSNIPDDKQEAMERCVQGVMDKGNDKESAIAICYTSVVEGKSIEDATKSFMERNVKSGARNNTGDRGRIRKIRQLAGEIDGVTREIEPDDEDKVEGEITEIPIKAADEALVYYGDAVKALGDGKVGGYLVRFTGDADPDIFDDFFSKDTFYGDAPGGNVYFEHGRDPKIGKRIFGKSVYTRDEFGIWAEMQLKRVDQYEQFLYRMAEKGKLAWSSGTPVHLMEREKRGNANWIKSWPLGLDDSLTLTPAEPRNRAMPLKSVPIMQLEDLLTDAPTEEVAQDSEEKPEAINTKSITNTEDLVMEITKEELQEMLNTGITTGVEKALKAMPAAPKDDVVVTTDEGDQPFASDGEFFLAVKSAAYHPSMEDPRLRAIKATGLSEGVPADGGYLLQTQQMGKMLERMYTIGDILQRVSKDPIGPNANSATYNGIDETSRVAGSRWGGLRGYWLAEGSTFTASKPKFRQINLKLKKVGALAYATDEQLQDTVNLESWLTRTVPDELRFQVEDAIFEGDGVGKPLGIMNAPCLVTVLRDTASTVVFADIVAMWARRWAGVKDYVWLINQDVTPKLDQLVLASSTEMPTRFIEYDASGVMRMKGRPVLEVEYAATMGDVGDIVLASLSQYQAIDKGGIQAASSIHVQFLTDETAFRFTYRIDGQASWHSALTPLHGSNTVSPFVALSSASV